MTPMSLLASRTLIVLFFVAVIVFVGFHGFFYFEYNFWGKRDKMHIIRFDCVRFSLCPQNVHSIYIWSIHSFTDHIGITFSRLTPCVVISVLFSRHPSQLKLVLNSTTSPTDSSSQPGHKVIKLLFMLKSTTHELYSAHKPLMAF